MKESLCSTHIQCKRKNPFESKIYQPCFISSNVPMWYTGIHSLCNISNIRQKNKSHYLSNCLSCPNFEFHLVATWRLNIMSFWQKRWYTCACSPNVTKKWQTFFCFFGRTKNIILFFTHSGFGIFEWVSVYTVQPTVRNSFYFSKKRHFLRRRRSKKQNYHEMTKGGRKRIRWTNYTFIKLSTVKSVKLNLMNHSESDMICLPKREVYIFF